MKRLAGLALSLAVAVTAPVFAQSGGRARNTESFASDFQTVPVMANTPGLAGATFQTYVALYNPTSSAFAVSVSLYDGAGNKRDATIQLAAGEIKTYTNFLDAVFSGFTGGGAVTLQSANNNRFIVNAEVRTVGSRYGTTIPVLEFAGTSSRSFSAGVTVDSNNRTNVGCFNQTAAANAVKATVYDNSGKVVVGTVTLNLPANGWGQTAVTSVVSGGLVQFDPADSAVCYAVVVDNSTNDGRVISAAEYKP